ncbi:hypothetical protein ACIQ2D_02580 [Lysinibacillus sp. NPDC097287]|uniref:hypothetical protein n=1 Tax=Lysinibacillus sp. NPDC097287 TaxID=3364144 RepID=UPI0037F7D1DA
MTTILIAVLFVLQLLSFYAIIILNTKLAKFKDLEKKQERLMREMDDTISVYLAEMKDENNRLISELQMVPKQQAVVASRPKEQDEQHRELETQQPTAEISSKEVNRTDIEVEPRVFVPKNIAVNAYSRQQHATNNTAKQGSSVATLDALIEEEQLEPTFEEQVILLSKQGKTVEGIAKQLQKGKTEIELLLKFHS